MWDDFVDIIIHVIISTEYGFTMHGNKTRGSLLSSSFDVIEIARYFTEQQDI